MCIIKISLLLKNIIMIVSQRFKNIMGSKMTVSSVQLLARLASQQNNTVGINYISSYQFVGYVPIKRQNCPTASKLALASLTLFRGSNVNVYQLKLATLANICKETLAKLAGLSKVSWCIFSHNNHMGADDWNNSGTPVAERYQNTF